MLWTSLIRGTLSKIELYLSLYLFFDISELQATEIKFTSISCEYLSLVFLTTVKSITTHGSWQKMLVCANKIFSLYFVFEQLAHSICAGVTQRSYVEMELVNVWTNVALLICKVQQPNQLHQSILTSNLKKLFLEYEMTFSGSCWQDACWCSVCKCMLHCSPNPVKTKILQYCFL